MAGFHYHCSPPIAPQVSVSLPTFNEKRHHAKSRRHIFLGLFWITFIFFTALLYCVPHMREIYSICINPQRIQPLIMGVVQQQYVVNFLGVRCHSKSLFCIIQASFSMRARANYSSGLGNFNSYVCVFSFFSSTLYTSYQQKYNGSRGIVEHKSV